MDGLLCRTIIVFKMYDYRTIIVYDNRGNLYDYRTLIVRFSYMFCTIFVHEQHLRSSTCASDEKTKCTKRQTSFQVRRRVRLHWIWIHVVKYSRQLRAASFDSDRAAHLRTKQTHQPQRSARHMWTTQICVAERDRAQHLHENANLEKFRSRTMMTLQGLVRNSINVR